MKRREGGKRKELEQEKQRKKDIQVRINSEPF